MPDHGTHTGTASTSSSLIRRVKAHEPQAWERLIQLYTPMVYGWARRGGLADTDAADVSQEVFRAVSQGIANLDKEERGSSFRGWLWGITRNHIRLHYRRREQQPEAFGGTDAALRMQQEPEDMDDESALSNLQGRTLLVHRALKLIRNDFTERNWQAFWRLAVDGQTATEIAEDLGMTPSAVRQAKYRVLCRLREELEGS